MGMLNSMVTGVKTDSAAMETARAAALNDLEVAGDNMNIVTMDYLHNMAFANTPFAFSTLGTTKNLKSLTGSDLDSFFSDRVIAKAMHVTCVGGVTEDAAIEAANKAFGGRAEGLQNMGLPPRVQPGEVKVRDDEMPLAHLAVCVEGPPASHPDSFTLNAVSKLFGNYEKSMGSPFLASSAQQLAASGQFAEFYSPINLAYRDTGLWGVYMTPNRYIVEDSVEILQEFWLRMKTDINQGEILRAKKMMQQEYIKTSQSSEDRSHQIARQSRFLGRVMSDEEVMQRIDEISSMSINRAMTEWVYDKAPIVAAIGPVEAMNDVTRTRSSMWSLFL